MRILLHICCAPCALMPVEELRRQGHELMGLWFNPNVQPYTENARRLETVRAWAAEEDLRLIVQDQYDIQPWLRAVAFRESLRCNFCYHQRLTRAAQVAKRGGFDAFSSTLLFSVSQKHRLLQDTGEAVAAERGVAFHYQDFRPFWKQGVAQSLERGLYRQQYCGCIYSEAERYMGAKRPAEDDSKISGKR